MSVYAAATGICAQSVVDWRVTLNVGASTFTMKKDGTITLNGKDITLTGTADIAVNASGTLTESAGGNVVVSGSQIHLN